jgi:LacI family transcriptional regulator
VSSDHGSSKRDVTMRDVAERAGVAISTVSRVISRPDRISARTRESVQQAMRELGYPAHGPRSARRSAGVGSVGVLVPDITNPFYFDIIRGTQDRLKDAGYMQVLIDTEESAEVEAASLELLRRTAVGAILTAPRQSDAELRTAARRHPLVTVNRGVRGVPHVIIDSGSGVAQAVEHLASLGHRRIAYVGGPAVSWSNGQRWEACLAAGTRLGLECVRLGPFAPRTASGPAAADTLLNTGVTAALAFNDLVAIGMLQRFTDRGIDVPGEISVVGCDDIFGADFCRPPLTTLTAPAFQAGRLATELLLAQTDGSGLTASRVLPVHLTIRESTAAAPSRRRTQPRRR